MKEDDIYTTKEASVYLKLSEQHVMEVKFILNLKS